MEPEEAGGKTGVAFEHRFERVHDGLVATAVARHDESPPAAAIDQERSEFRVLFAQFVAGVLEPARSEIAVNLDLDGPTSLVDGVSPEAPGLDRHRGQLTGPAVDLRATVCDQRIEIGRPDQTATRALHQSGQCNVPVGRFGAADLRGDVCPTVRLARIDGLEERCIFVGRTRGGQAADAVDKRLQFASDGRIGEVGDLFRGDAALADVELLLELPDHVPCRRDAGGRGGTGSEQPHEISAAL